MERSAVLQSAGVGRRYRVKNIFDATYFPTALSAGGYVGQPRFFFFQAKYHL